MGDSWQLEAVKEQFRIMNNVRNPPQVIGTNDTKAVIKAVTYVLYQHKLQLENAKGQVRDLSVEIIRQHDGLVKFDFVTIVTDQKQANGQFKKIPLILIEYENKSVYIDLKCCCYNSWEAYMKQGSKALPNCNICFPVDGQYKDNRKLNVNFASFEVKLGKSSVIFFKWGIAAAAAVATVLFNTVPLITICNGLVNLAKKFVPGLIEGSFMETVMNLVKTIQSVKSGNLMDCPEIFNHLRHLFEKYKDEIDVMRNSINKVFRKVCEFLNKYICISNSNPIRLLSIVHSTNDEYMQSIFRNCQNAFQRNAKGKLDVPNEGLHPYTKSLLRMSIDVSKSPNIDPVGTYRLSQNDLADNFQGLKILIQEKMEQKFGFYKQCIRAATESTGNAIDIDKFNKSLGINGCPKAHFMKEAIEAVENSPLLDIALKKCAELKEQEPVLLIHIVQVPNNEKVGVFKCVGKGKLLVPAKSCLKAISNRIGIDEKKCAMKEENYGNESRISIFCDNYVVFILQKITEHNDVEGMAIILEI